MAFPVTKATRLIVYTYMYIKKRQHEQQGLSEMQLLRLRFSESSHRAGLQNCIFFRSRRRTSTFTEKKRRICDVERRSNKLSISIGSRVAFMLEFLQRDEQEPLLGPHYATIHFIVQTKKSSRASSRHLSCQ
jgi:hypothetical protein